MEWTYYQPPKSQGFGHFATPRNPLAAWNVLETFIKDHAITNEWFPTGLTIDARPEFWTPSSLEGVLATLTALEGKPDLIPGGMYASRPSKPARRARAQAADQIAAELFPARRCEQAGRCIQVFAHCDEGDVIINSRCADKMMLYPPIQRSLYGHPGNCQKTGRSMPPRQER
jgi:hypothetical protein